MRIVDSHCHTALGWYEPIEVLLAQMDRNGVEQVVLIQMNGQTDNSYQAECVRRYPDRVRSAAIVDAKSPDAPAALERAVAEGATGLRLDISSRAPGDDPLALWRKAAELGIAISCRGQRDEYLPDSAAEVFEAFPMLPIVIEHIGGLKAADLRSSERPKMFDLARFPNAYVKIHGLGEFSQRAMPPTEPFPFVQPIAPLVEMAYEAFGASRMMWGSDYPPVSVREGYANSLCFTMDRLADKSDEERALIFGGVAAKVFGF